MHDSLLEVLRCRSCRRSYELCCHEAEGAEILWGYLRCPDCAIVIPIAAGFAFFTEPLIHAGLASRAALEQRADHWFGSAAAHATYRRQKSERGGHEPYAAFHPFNESTRAIDPLMPCLAAHVPVGGLVLDAWSRTGWSAEDLASRFPAQRVVALWEGERSVLGYRGYRHWLGSGQRAGNLDVLFVHPEHGLPFRDGSFHLVYALDSIHRFSLQAFAAECWRVAAKEGALALAHLHLTNSEPDPWFDRGCIMRHGRDYRAWLDRLLAPDHRRGWVVSEIDLFQAKPGALLTDNPNTSHYNGFALIADPHHVAAHPLAAAAQPTGDGRLLVNPMFKIHLGRNLLRVEPGLLGGSVGELFSRHPVYRDHLPTQPMAVSEAQIALLALAVTGATLAEMAGQLGCGLAEIQALAAPLLAADVVLPVTVSKTAVDLQRFHAHQLPVRLGPDLLADFLRAMMTPTGDAQDDDAVLRNQSGDAVALSDVPALLALVIGFLRHRGIGQGSRLALPVMTHPLGLILVLAGAALGCHVLLGRDITDPLSQGPVDLLIHGDDDIVDPAQWGQVIALGLDGAPGSLLGSLPESTPATMPAAGNPLPATARISLGVADRVITLPALTVVEAALSLAPQAATDVNGQLVPWGLAGLLSGLIGLAQRVGVVLGPG